MKLLEILPDVVTKFSDFVKANEEALKQHTASVLSANEYRDLDTRIAWDIFRACYSSHTICGWYDKYGCHDSHVNTIVKRAYEDSGAKKIVARLTNKIAA